ncbi:MAG: sugar transporter permease, partial [Paenibacillus sp.]|nr:sugar transporter permease [Paenibacillus sp.]
MIAVFYFYPMIQALILSFKSGKGMNLSFVGFDNYARLFSDKTFITAVKNTFIYL